MQKSSQTDNDQPIYDNRPKNKQKQEKCARTYQEASLNSLEHRALHVNTNQSLVDPREAIAHSQSLP